MLKTLEKLDPARRCFRSIGGVLVERTVGEVVPAVTLNKDNVRDLAMKKTLLFSVSCARKR